MLTKTLQESWSQFLEFIDEHCTATEYENWFASIRVLDVSGEEIQLEVTQYLCAGISPGNYKKNLCAFLPARQRESLRSDFVIATSQKKF